MEVIPSDVGHVSRLWDDQHLYLSAASRALADAPCEGFTPDVAAAAGRFLAAWSVAANALGDVCEARADGLRAAIADYLATDQANGLAYLTLATFVEERR